MKIQIPESVQELIKCSNCNELLSCGPVFLVHETSDAICGRCSPQDTESSKSEEIRNRTRNLQYEATAKLLSFPCSFADRGCTEQLDFSSDEPCAHELTCEFRPFICPIVDRGSCDWIGIPCNLTEHCNDAHPSHLFDNNSSVPRPDLTKSHLINYLITAYNLIFLLHFKVCKSTGKLYHSLRMIGDSGLLENFTYILEIEGNKTKLIEEGSILSRGIMMLQEPTSICIKINNLLDFLGGKYNEAKFTVKIQTTLIFCVNCLKTIETGSYSMFCQECEGKLIKCTFNTKGCLFVGFNKSKCEKHEMFFCKYLTKCCILDCGVNFVAGSFFEHLQSSNSCHKTIKSNINSVVRFTNTNNKWDFILFSNNNIGTIMCEYILFNSNLRLWLYSSLPWHELKNFKCSIELTDPQTKQTKLLTPQIQNNNPHDWEIYEEMNNFPSWQNIGLDLKLVINK